LERARHLLSVLESHCNEVDRDPAEITKTRMSTVAIAPTHERAMAKVNQMRQAGVPEERLAAVLAGDAGEVAEQAHAFAEIGVEGMTLSLPDVHDLETVALAGNTLGPVFASAVA
jgi:alkanesulfonate monooxygenase SsuD/methylene tetrahydromethanopterin reductase-like flavin-dependent oxidoreductase (luciferase family)